MNSKKSFFRHISGSQSKCDRCSTTYLISMNKIINKPLECANLFNEYFSAVYQNNDCALTQEFDLNTELRYSVSTNESLDAFNNMNQNNAQSPATIPLFLWYKINELIIVPLCWLFEILYKTSCIPSDWSFASVFPLYKGSDSSPQVRKFLAYLCY